MKRFAPLPLVTGLFMAIALPLKAGEIGETGQTAITPVDQIVEVWIDLQKADQAVTQVVCAWIDEHQAGLTAALDEKLTDVTDFEMRVPDSTQEIPIPNLVIPVSTLPLHRLPHTPSV